VTLCFVRRVAAESSAKEKKLGVKQSAYESEAVKLRLSFGTIFWTLAKRSKGARGMPRREQAKKDVASCEKPWGVAR
jgi:hypothetical protein